MNKIEKIIENKRRIIGQSKRKISTDELKKKAYDYKSTFSSGYAFQDILKENGCSLICEYKVSSPSRGHISNLSLKETVTLYDENPVDAISILTEELYFNSNLKKLEEARMYTSKPLLRKDFIIDEYMIYEAALNDASCILLIEGICPDMEGYLDICYDLEMDAIVECHEVEDILNVEKYNPMIIGVNNRNLNDFTINLDKTRTLKEYVPNYMISESGVKSIADAERLNGYEADGILIGSSIMENDDKIAITSYINKLHQVLKKDKGN